MNYVAPAAFACLVLVGCSCQQPPATSRDKGIRWHIRVTQPDGSPVTTVEFLYGIGCTQSQFTGCTDSCRFGEFDRRGYIDWNPTKRPDYEFLRIEVEGFDAGSGMQPHRDRETGDYWGNLVVHPLADPQGYDPFFCPICIPFHCSGDPGHRCEIDFGTVVVEPRPPP